MSYSSIFFNSSFCSCRDNEVNKVNSLFWPNDGRRENFNVWRCLQVYLHVIASLLLYHNYVTVLNIFWLNLTLLLDNTLFFTLHTFCKVNFCFFCIAAWHLQIMQLFFLVHILIFLLLFTAARGTSESWGAWDGKLSSRATAGQAQECKVYTTEGALIVGVSV